MLICPGIGVENGQYKGALKQPEKWALLALESCLWSLPQPPDSF